MEEKRVINVKELAQLYIQENCSMELLSKIYHIPIATMSRILWKFNLPDMKKQFYPRGIPMEKKDLKNIENVPESIKSSYTKRKGWEQKEVHMSAEDLFFED